MLTICSSYICCSLCQPVALLGVTASWVLILVKFTVLDWLGCVLVKLIRDVKQKKKKRSFFQFKTYLLGTIPMSYCSPVLCSCFFVNLMNRDDHVGKLGLRLL